MGTIRQLRRPPQSIDDERQNVDGALRKFYEHEDERDFYVFIRRVKAAIFWIVLGAIIAGAIGWAVSK
jgi:hypothetical protein